MTYDQEHSDEELAAVAEEIVEAIERPKRGTRENLSGDTPGGWLPTLSLPSFGDAYEECGDERPHFCGDCGHPIEIGRTCARSMCPRCWSAWVMKRAGTSREQGREVPGYVSQLIKTAKMKSSRLGGEAVFHHHMAIMPPMDDWYLAAEDPLARTKDVIKEIMDAVNMEGIIVYHPWSGDNEEHEGDDRGEWKHRIGEGREWDDDVRKELKPRGHFHVVGCSPYVPGEGVTDRVHEATGWVIKRIARNDGVSLEHEEDIAGAVTYTLSHAGVDTRGEQNRAAVWKHGATYHDGQVSAADRKAGDAAVRRAAPRTLGVSGRNITCYEELPEGEVDDHDGMHHYTGDCCDGGDGGGVEATASESVAEPVAADGGTDTELVECSGPILPMREAEHILDDEERAEGLVFENPLRQAYRDWLEDNPPD